MILDLRDPASIAAWYAVAPDRHGPQLAAMAKVLPQFAGAIKAAGQQVRAGRAQHSRTGQAATEIATETLPL